MPRASARLGIFATVALLLGPLAAYLEVIPPLAGFGVFALAIPVALIGTLLAIVSLIRGPADRRGTAWQGLLSCVLVLGVILAVAAPGGNVPRINDITTDTQDPPTFVHAQTLPANSGRDMSYPGPDFAHQQQDGYPDLAPISLSMPADEAFVVVRETAGQMDGWTITEERPATRTLEGFQTTAIFRFQDDFVIEVREAGTESVIQMRSKSRDGKGDIGANAARIRSFFEALRGRASAGS